MTRIAVLAAFCMFACDSASAGWRDEATQVYRAVKRTARDAAHAVAPVYTCEDVKAGVNNMGAEELERQARARGASEKQIRAGKRCLR
jgi:hypothetical protein